MVLMAVDGVLEESGSWIRSWTLNCCIYLRTFHLCFVYVYPAPGEAFSVPLMKASKFANSVASSRGIASPILNDDLGVRALEQDKPHLTTAGTFRDPGHLKRD